MADIKHATTPTWQLWLKALMAYLMALWQQESRTKIDPIQQAYAGEEVVKASSVAGSRPGSPDTVTSTPELMTAKPHEHWPKSS